MDNSACFLSLQGVRLGEGVKSKKSAQWVLETSILPPPELWWDSAVHTSSLAKVPKYLLPWELPLSLALGTQIFTAKWIAPSILGRTAALPPCNWGAEVWGKLESRSCDMETRACTVLSTCLYPSRSFPMHGMPRGLSSTHPPPLPPLLPLVK